MNTFGQYFRMTSFGESHGVAMGVVVDGCPSGVPFSMDILQEHLNRRRPGRFPWQTARKEEDIPQVLSGVFENKTLGTPIAMIVENQNQRSKDYDFIKDNPRKGHADDLWKEKFLHSDHRGGGRASGRETVSRVMGGAVASMLIRELHSKLKILSYATQIGHYELTNEELDDQNLTHKKIESFPAFFPHKKKSEKIQEMLLQAKKEGQSYGGRAVIHIQGLPRGLGQPVFKKLKSDLTQALMGVGTVYRVSLGEADESSSGQNFHQNPLNYSGIRGGLSSGEDIHLHVSFKPPSSIGKVSQEGRHDPCVIPRAIPVLESMVYLVLADHILAQRLDHI